MNIFDLSIIMLLIIGIIAYTIGYNRGLKKGFEQGKATSGLWLKEESLHKGHCILCQSQKENIDEKSNISKNC